MQRDKFERIMDHIVKSIDDAGYSAEEQLAAYVLTGDDYYITRNGNAREWIKKLDIKQIKRYIKQNF